MGASDRDSRSRAPKSSDPGYVGAVLGAQAAESVKDGERSMREDEGPRGGVSVFVDVLRSIHRPLWSLVLLVVFVFLLYKGRIHDDVVIGLIKVIATTLVAGRSLEKIAGRGGRL
ncbi:MAG: hypothetical protein CUN57_00030 [Phototrophicales bacterium]|nr:MAG: hypothetical protein CUN57_00030 [Phototrophicales bacterium]